ncbi:hypothetical protein [Vibrio sp.]|uniref:hypothetical protein n=1 Tax=Vibrio sp. TaxID=678 RepID=UPI003AA8F796
MNHPYTSIHSKRAIENQLELAEEKHHNDEYMQGVVDALMWILGQTPPPAED